MGKLFGTDGIRGVANKELTPELAFKISRIGAHVLSRQSQGKKAFLIARDTRISGEMLEGALVAGLTSAGVDVYLAGVISTPGAAFLTKQLGGCGGIMISASHNAYPDNGIKFFNAGGFKLSDEVEAEIEDIYFLPEDTLPRPEAKAVGRVYHDTTADDRYLEYLLSTVSCRLDGIRVVLDCANGAASNVAPRAFRTLGAEVVAINDQPDGININNKCGSTYPEAVSKAVAAQSAQIGFTFDGDADRVLAVDEAGSLVDGDAIMMVLAMALKAKGKLRNDTVVATVMSNLGLEKAAEEQGFHLLRTKVGDRYVLEEMLSGNHSLGGEQSGHVILLDYNTTGDGLLVALQMMAVLAQTGKSLTDLTSPFIQYPQVLVNCRVGSREGWDTNTRIGQAIEETEARIAGRGRLLVRPSGTEPLIRVMMEGPNEEELHMMANELAAVIKEEQG